MELQLGQVLSQMMETMKGMQLQQAQLQQALQSSDKTVGEAPEKKSIDVLIKLLQNHIAPEPGEVALQHKFCLRQQQEGESIANYVAGLKGIGVKLRTYTGEILQPLGTCNVNIKYRDSEVQGRVFIIDRKVDPVIGREWIRKLNIQFDINSIHKEENDITEKEFKEKLHKLLEQYRELFTEEIGEINNFQATYRLKAGTSPIFLKPRPVPLALRDQWGTPVVPVIKQNGKVRLCADYRATLNKNIEDDNYPIPRIEEIFSKLSGGKYFCTLDINSAYHMPTNEETAEMQTISTCKGSYKVKRLMFGVKVAPNIWQRYMDQTLQGMEGTACFFDDIALQGSTYIQLLQRITAVFKKLTKCGLHLNKKKCQFFERSVTYLGHTINENGLHPTQEKIKDIKNSPQPTEVSSLRTFLGMINYYQQFIPNLASKLNPLYQLLKKDAVFQWSVQCEKAFQELKEEICGDKVLIPFHADLPVTLATDASPTGFGGVLSHIMPDKTERPIAFASRSLTKAEKGYSQLDKEAAALIWGLKKFFQYCYGRKITLIIDNQPLARILHPEKTTPATTAIRLVHYANFLAGFDYNIKLRKTTEHANADYFSRLNKDTTGTEKTP
ncbi:Retrovirus-related Pol polyprotein from transposon 412 [Eumeta japonica]|uniref:Retrovirus-related Pol polyprotein from transposon 412 n=3 Tax=Eumeta variegata TaxID=151549 RepID=A0A4C1WBT2_EUMVA|nr:Retrovirus-related Pol polyprotein from transposon 412 [Eumeta japonica]